MTSLKNGSIVLLATALGFLYITLTLAYLQYSHDKYISVQQYPSVPNLQGSFTTKGSCLSSWNAKNNDWKERHQERLSLLSDQSSFFAEFDQPRRRFDPFEPEFSCGLESRMGTSFGDGGKWVCDFDSIVKFSKQDSTKCIVFSIGSAGDTSFEEDILSRSNRSCEIFTFDPYLGNDEGELAAHAKSRGINFQPWALSTVTSPSAKYYRLYDLPYALNLTSSPIPDEDSEEAASSSSFDSFPKEKELPFTVNLLKVDCDGCEFTTLAKGLIASKIKVEQLLLEVHLDPSDDYERKGQFEQISNLFHQLDWYGMRIFHKEPNHWGCEGYKCSEFSFITEEAAFKSHVQQICPEWMPQWQELYSHRS